MRTPPPKRIDKKSRILIRNQQVISQTTVGEIIRVNKSMSLSGVPEIWLTTKEDLHSGDCIMHAGARMIFRANGTTHWSAVLRSSDTNDRWEMKLYWYKSDGSYLFTMPSQAEGDAYYYFEMKDANKDYTWEQDRWKFDKATFSAIRWGGISYRC